ncbi:MAG: hypothetical protein ROO71_09260 [Balneola sp.]
MIRAIRILGWRGSSLRLFLLIVFVGLSLCIEQEFYIFSRENTPELLKQCSRWVPYVTATWKINDESIEKLKSDFTQITMVKEKIYRDSTNSIYFEGRSISNLSEYDYQIGGVNVDGTQYLYLNAFPEDYLDDWPTNVISIPDLNTDPIKVCDGGSSFWGILYNPKTREFSELSINGG